MHLLADDVRAPRGGRGHRDQGAGQENETEGDRYVRIQPLPALPAETARRLLLPRLWPEPVRMGLPRSAPDNSPGSPQARAASPPARKSRSTKPRLGLAMPTICQAFSCYVLARLRTSDSEWPRAARSASKSTGLTRWALKPASWERRRSSS